MAFSLLIMGVVEVLTAFVLMVTAIRQVVVGLGAVSPVIHMGLLAHRGMEDM